MENESIDIQGFLTLDVISAATNFNEWMYKTISPYCSGRILEIGSGIGNISSFFINDNKDIVLSDINSNYHNELKSKFDHPVLDIDIAHEDFKTVYHDYLGSFDCVFALNVVEHIASDDTAIKNCKLLLRKGGNLVILVPAYQFLFCDFDLELGHFRRYTATKLKKQIETIGLSVMEAFYFNTFGTIGWFVFGKLLKRKLIPESKMRIFDKLVPAVKHFDVLFGKKFGLSTIVISNYK